VTGLPSELADKKRISSIEIVDFKGIPVYDGDVEEESGIPDKVKKIAEKIRAADGVYISTPEYNYGYSAALKNIIDWLSSVDEPEHAKMNIMMDFIMNTTSENRVAYDFWYTSSSDRSLDFLEDFA